MTDLLRRRIAESDEFTKSRVVVLDDLRAPEILDLAGQLDLVRPSAFLLEHLQDESCELCEPRSHRQQRR